MEKDLDLVRKVIEILEESQVDELEIDMGEMRIRAKKSSSAPPQYAAPPPPPPAPAPAEAAAGGAAPAPAEETGVVTITAPMVGTLYRSPAPDAPPFVQVGDTVDEGAVVCILEAMKVMNEIKAEVSGTIVDILIENGMPVEFGQPLFKVRTG